MNAPARSIAAVETVLKKSWRKQAPSASIQRHRKLIAAAKRSRNQVDLSLLDQAAGPVVPRGSVLLQQVAASSAAVQTDNSEDVLWD